VIIKRDRRGRLRDKADLAAPNGLVVGLDLVANQVMTTGPGDGRQNTTRSDSGICMACGNPTRLGAIRRNRQEAASRGLRAVMKVFLPTGRAAGASFVFDTTRSRFTETGCAVR
jgi:hypothetical protein